MLVNLIAETLHKRSSCWSMRSEKVLTEKIGEPLRLIVMFNCHADGIEEHKDDDEPVELLRLDGAPYPEPELLLGLPELQASALLLHFRL